jgi:hypothetical protein
LAGALTAAAFTWKSLLRGLWALGMRLAESDLKTQVDTMYKDRVAVYDAAVEQTGANTDSLIAFEAALKEQGNALVHTLTNGLEKQTHAVERIADNTDRSFRELQKEASATAQSVAHIAGFLAAQRGYQPPIT